MTTRKRKTIPKGVTVHVFQRARHGFVVFYNSKDSLVFLTIFSILAARHKVCVLGLCVMHNHIHILMEDATSAKVMDFMRIFALGLQRFIIPDTDCPEICSALTDCLSRRMTRP